MLILALLTSAALVIYVIVVPKYAISLSLNLLGWALLIGSLSFWWLYLAHILMEFL